MYWVDLLLKTLTLIIIYFSFLPDIGQIWRCLSQNISEYTFKKADMYYVCDSGV